MPEVELAAALRRVIAAAYGIEGQECGRRALNLLNDVGYQLSGGALKRKSDGRPFAFEILVSTRDQERIALAFGRDLKRAGITPTISAIGSICK